MYQEDMVDADGYGGCPLPPRVKPPELLPDAREAGEQEDANTKLSYDQSRLADPTAQRQYHQYPVPTSQPLAPQYFDAGLPSSEIANSANQRQSRTRNRSCSPSRRPQRSSSSLSPGKTQRPVAIADQYHLMPIEVEQRKSEPKSKRLSTEGDEADEKYEAQVALGVQMTMVFFCLLIIIAVSMALLSHSGYLVVILVFLSILLLLVVSLCCFLYKVVHEDNAPRVNQKHMPRWYRTLTKMIKDEITDFREDWMAMCNNLYLLEDGDVGDIPAFASSRRTTEAAEAESMQQKPKKRKGKSSLFKLVAKPAAVLASFRSKRKEKRRQRKNQTYMPEPSFPSTI